MDQMLAAGLPQVATLGGTVLPLAGRALCVPKISSASCDQAVFVDQAADASLSSDVVLVEVGRFG